MITRIVTDFAAIGTFLGVGFAAWQLLLTRQQAKTEFEDRVTELYRTLAASLPVEVFFDEPVDREIVESHRAVFYRYFDLCNEQAFLHEQHRISDATWKQWRDGMAGNMRRDAFDKAWFKKIEPHIGSDFQEFKRVLKELKIAAPDPEGGHAE